MTSYMHLEALEAPEACARALAAAQPVLKELVTHHRSKPFRFVVTAARGSSDAAARYLAYRLGRETGLVIASWPPSLSSLHDVQLRAQDALFVAISQSGMGPDILASCRAAQAGGATILAMVNDLSSPLAAFAKYVLPMSAGVERSVAATKTCIVSMALCGAIASALGEKQNHNSPKDIVAALAKASHLPPCLEENFMKRAQSVYILARGPLLAVAVELALKLKEVCGIHAEAVSAAEFKHGPSVICGPSLRLVALVDGQASESSMSDALALAASAGTRIASVSVKGSGDAHALALLLRLYLDVEALASRSERNVDRPQLLEKVTRTT